MKRVFDVSASLVLLMLALPVLLLAVIAIWLDATGPIFYWQERVGLAGKLFKICVDPHAAQKAADTRYPLNPDGSP